MDRRNLPPLRSLPRVFIEDLCNKEDLGPIELPQEELDKFRKVLRLSSGDQVAVLPGDRRIIRCELHGREVVPIEVRELQTESPTHLTLVIALPKLDRLETVIRMGTEMGVAGFVIFPSERSVIKWEASKLQEKLRRLRTIIRESAEQSFRACLPDLRYVPSLSQVLKEYPDILFLSEVETVNRKLQDFSNKVVLAIGPEGGWAPREVLAIGDRAITLGPRVLRVDSAAAAACALTLLR